MVNERIDEETKHCATKIETDGTKVTFYDKDYE